MDYNRIAALLLTLAVPAAVADADEITFDEVTPANLNCCFLSEEYVDMGVEFVTTDDGSIWAGASNGDPGNWRIEGTNGPAFLGFNGQAYSARTLFDSPVVEFTMDVARASGSLGTARIKLTGYLAGEVVSRNAVYLGEVNEWFTVPLAGEIDEVAWRTSESGGIRPYAVDNLQWVPAVPPMMYVEIDIKPDSDLNSINPTSSGVIPVLLFGSEALAVADVNPDSLAFGPAGAARAHRNGPHYTDLDGDGLLDLLAHFRVPETGVMMDDTELCLSGESFEGVPFEGCDGLITVRDDDEDDDGGGDDVDDDADENEHEHKGTSDDKDKSKDKSKDKHKDKDKGKGKHKDKDKDKDKDKSKDKSKHKGDRDGKGRR